MTRPGKRCNGNCRVPRCQRPKCPYNGPGGAARAKFALGIYRVIYIYFDIFSVLKDLGIFRAQDVLGDVKTEPAKLLKTVIRFVSTSAKFGICTVMGLKWTLKGTRQ
jgi:hypothetical protein